MLARLQDKSAFAPIEDPASLQGTLRDYQRRGVAWLQYLESLGLNPCLADDMGLGKTLQVITRLLMEREQAPDAPAGLPPTLIIAPTSVLGNWRKEIERFAPELRTMVHQGADRIKDEKGVQGRQRRARRRPDLVRAGPPGREAVAQSDLAPRGGGRGPEHQEPAGRPDQGDPQAGRAPPPRPDRHARREPPARPLVDLQLPQPRLPRQGGAVPQVVRGADPQGPRPRPLRHPQEAGRAVHPAPRQDRPPIIDDLPDKIEQKMYCTLTPEQASLYEAVVKDVERKIEELDGIERRGLILATLMRLKQICNHPAQFLADGSAFTPERSHKLQRLGEMVEELIESGESALIFTQFTEIGAALERYLGHTRHFQTYYLHGGTSAARRDRMVAEFQDPETPAVRLHPLAASRRRRPEPDQGEPRLPLRSLVEPGRRGPGDRPGVPDRPAEERLRPQVRLARHHGREDRRHDRGEEAALLAGRRHRRSLADRARQRHVQGPDRAATRRRAWTEDRTAMAQMAQFGRTWWGERFLKALEQFTDAGRLGRGRAYASNGRIVEHKLERWHRRREGARLDQPVLRRLRGADLPHDHQDHPDLSRRLVEGDRADRLAGGPDHQAVAAGDAGPDRGRLRRRQGFTCCRRDRAISRRTAPARTGTTPASTSPASTTCWRATWTATRSCCSSCAASSRDALHAELIKSPLGADPGLLARTDDVPLAPAESFHTRPTKRPAGSEQDRPRADRPPDASGAGSHRRLPADQPRPRSSSSQARVPALLVKKQGDYPPFWHKDSSFIEVMEELYERVRTKSPQMK